MGNIFQNNAGSAITIDANSIDAELRGDSGRESGFIDRDLTLDFNRGPLFRENELFNNGINGLEIRGDATTNNRNEEELAVRDLQRNILTTESVWDDTDLVHVLFESITVSNLEHSGGLRLQSAINESLVIKLEGQGSNFDKERGTGITATGRFGSVTDRVGGTVHVIGQPGFPVVLTSLRDDTVGAGTQPDGRPQSDTNNDGIGSIPRPGDWRSMLFDTFSNDRNVVTVMEIEAPDTVAPGSNDTAVIAQFLGALAPNESTTDENLPLGYVMHGVLSEPNDQDVYSFVATAGTEVWFDVDSTTYALDTVIEILNANGDLLARSDNSTDEQAGVASVFTSPLIDPKNANPLVRRVNSTSRRNESGLLKDDYTTNTRDAGLRLLLPGIAGTQSSFFFRIRSSSTNIENPASGLTRGSYSVQIRLRDQQEFPGSTVQFANIRYATNGVYASGLPYHSPLTGEANTGMFDGSDDGITQLGNLQLTDRQSISVAGQLGGSGNLMQFTIGDQNVLNQGFGSSYPISIDVDYADGLNRPDLTAFLFSSQGLFVGRDSSIVDDRPGPLRGSDLTDLSRGSVGTKDPFIGSVALPRGTYDLAVTGPGAQAVALARNTVLFDQSFETLTYRSIQNPALPTFIPSVFTSLPANTIPATFVSGPVPVLEGGTGGTTAFEARMTANNAVVEQVRSVPFTIPTTWDSNDPIRFSLNYKVTPGVPLTVRLYNNTTATAPTVFSATLNSADPTMWDKFVVDMSSVFGGFGGGLPGQTYQFTFSTPANTAATFQLDDIYLGIWTPRYAPIDTYRFAANESFEGIPSATASTAVLFDPASVGTGQNLWQFATIGPSRNNLYRGSNVLAFRSTGSRLMSDGAAGEIVSNPFNLINDQGTWGYFSYDFAPHDPSEQLEAFIRIPGRPDALVASTMPGAAPVTLARTNGQWEQARFDMRPFEGFTGQLVFSYDTQGPNRLGSGDTGYAYIDDVMIGLQSRGERVTNTTNSRAFLSSGFGGNGDYQVEIRKSDSTAVVRERYDRGSFSTSLLIPTGLSIPDKSVMELSDGANRIKFQFTYDGSFDFGNTPIVVSATSTPAQIARAVRDGINTVFTQNRFRVSAANSNGVDTGSAGANYLVHLVGDVEFLSGANLFGPNGIINFEGFGDVNSRRDQGQFVVNASTITDSRDYGIFAAPADLYYADGRAQQPLYTVGAPSFLPNYVGAPGLGGAYARKLPILNTVPFAVAPGSPAERAGLAPGMVVTNNVMDSSGLGGLHIEGQTPFWRITAFPGINDLSQTANAQVPPDHSGTFTDDGDSLIIDYGRQKVRFEFEEISGSPTNTVGGDGWNADRVPIYYREDAGVTYLRAPTTSSGYAADEMVKAIRDSIMGSVLVTNGTTQNIKTWVEPQGAFVPPPPANTTATGGFIASIILQGPQDIQTTAGVSITRLGEYSAAPYVRAVNNTIIGKDGRANFNAQSVDSNSNSTIAGATETWQGTGTNPAAYTVNGTITADPLSTGSSDVDMYKFTLEVGDRVLVNVDTLLTSNLDAALKIFDANGRAQNITSGSDPTTVDSQAAPGESGGLDPYVDFTAKVAGVYYAAISASGNTVYDPLSLADRRRGTTSGNYSLSLKVLKPESFVITAEDPASYANGQTFTIDQVADFANTTNRTTTFEFTRTGVVQTGNIPVYIGPEYRVVDMARSIAGAINAAGMLNQQNLDNGSFGLANPLAPVSAIALGGINGHVPTLDINTTNSNGDVGVNSGNIRGAEVEAGLNRYRGITDRGATDDVSPVDVNLFFTQTNGATTTTSVFRGHIHRGIGHDRTMTLPFLTSSPAIPITALGNGTTEKYVVVRNASSINSNGNIRVDKNLGDNHNLNQILPETGILVTGGASPTLLNNVFVNVQTPIVTELTAAGRSVRPSAVVVGGNTYQYAETRVAFAYLGQPIEAAPTNVPNTAFDFNFTAGNNEKLFVDVPGGNFLPASSSQVIDSSIDSLADRSGYRTVKQAVGISSSPILAPDRDNSGQLRSDDPNIAPPSGLGGNIFKDRGAIDRADFVGPTAVIVNPIDNDAERVDIDNTMSVVRLSSGVYPEFRIQLKDGFETSNLQAGTGIDDDSVTGRDGGNRQPGSVLTITENGRLLVEGIDYAFSYNVTTNEILLRPLAGVWKNEKVYDITLNNKDRFVVDAPAGDQIGDGNSFTALDSSGGNVTFEFDSGYRLQLPQGIELLVPLAGGGAGGINDGDRFIVNNGAASFTFEFDNNNNSIAGNTRIPFTSLSTKSDISNAIVAALSTIPGIAPRIIGTGDVFVGAPLGAYIDTTDAVALVQPKSTFGLLVPSLGTRPGGIVDGQTFGVSDGRQSLIFEFDSDTQVSIGNIRVDISSASTAAEVAVVIKNALDNSGLALATQIVANDKVYLGLPNSGRVDTVNSNLDLVGVSRSLVDGQSITITRTVGAVVTTRVFELDSNGSGSIAGSVLVPITVSDTQSDIGQKLATAIRNAGLGLEPQHVGDGNIYIGGTAEYTISVANAPSVGLFGRPGVRGNTTLDIFGTLLLQIPARGGVDIAEDTRFTITNNSRTVTFEFDGNFSGPTFPGNVVIPYSAATTASDLVTTMLPIISGAGLAINPRDAGGGRIDLGLLPNSAVNPLTSAVTISRGSVVDGDYFTINNGTSTATFEFENLSIGNGRDPSRLAIRYNNQSSRADVFAAMKAAIESSLLGLTTVIQADGLKLLDNARFSTNIDNAPSLTLTGVPGGAIPISFVQDSSFTATQMRDAIVRSINEGFASGKTTLQAKVRGGSTLYIENAVNISPEVNSFFLRGIADNAGNFLKSNRINNETQFTILMPGVLLDFGDAPDPVTTTPGRYPTSLGLDGARHVSNATPLRLGQLVSSELDGSPTPRADGDTADDGVKFKFQGLDKPMFNRNLETLITVTLATPGILDGWIDFNADGDWTDASETVMNGVVFTESTLTQQFRIRLPSSAPVPTVSTNTFARFRVSTAGNTLPTGLALDGEVEDYLVRIVPGTPPLGTADAYTMNEDQAGGLVTTDSTGSLTPGFVVDDGVLANDTSTDGRPLLARIVTEPQHAVPGTFVFNPNGTFSYTPVADYFGTDSFVYLSYVNLDSSEGEILESLTPTTVTIQIRPANDVPVASNFSRTIDEDVQLVLSPQDVILLSQATPGPANEAGQTLRVSLPNSVSTQGGSVTLTNAGIVYTPRTDFSGVDTFNFTLTDDGITGVLSDPLSITRTVTITVRDKNDLPITTPKSFSMVEDGSDTRATTFFIAGDTAGPIPEITGPNAQTITFTGVEPTSEFGGTVTFVNGQVTYRPAADFNGVDRFFYLVTDNGTSQGNLDPQTGRGTVTVTVTAVNDAPRVVGSLGTISMFEDEAERALPLRNYFFDPDVIPNDDRLTYRVVSNTNPNLVEPTFGATDMFVRPKPDQNGTAIVVIEAADRAGNAVTNTMTLTVTPVNDAPRLVSPLPNLSVSEDTVIPNITLSPTFFFDPDAALNGDSLVFSVTNTNPDVVTATIVNGQLRLVLVPDASGVASITVRCVDSTGNAIEDTFDIAVAPANDAPRVVDDLFYLTPQGVELRTTDPRGSNTTTLLDDGVLANDRDIEGNAFTARVVQQPSKGTVTLNPDGTFTYVPNATALKGDVDSFRYEAVDSLGAVSTSALVNISITTPPPPRHQNPIQNLDVDADGFVSPIDVLLIINFLNFNGSSVSVVGLPDPPPYRDVNGDNFISPLDVLAVINFINNRRNGGAGEGEGEGQGIDPRTLAAPLAWSELVVRDKINSSTKMVDAGSYSSSPVLPVTPDVGLVAYLGSFGTETQEEAERLAILSTSETNENDIESLDSFFADLIAHES
ncbi:MAG: Ig-like domain-containing protein [Pirellula sp.]